MAVLYPEQGDAWMGFLLIGMVAALSYFPDTGKLLAKQEQLAAEESQEVDSDHRAAKPQEDFPPLAYEAQDELLERKQRFDKLVQHWTFLSNPNSNRLEDFSHEKTPDSVIGIPLFVDTTRRRSRSRSRSIHADVLEIRSPRRPSLCSPMLKANRSTERLSPTPRHSALGGFARVLTAPFQRNWLKTTLASSHLVGSSPRTHFHFDRDSPNGFSSKSPHAATHKSGNAGRLGLANWLWGSR